MNFKNTLTVVFGSAIIITALFYKQAIGLNLVFFEILLIIWLLISKQIDIKNSNHLICSIGFLTSSVCTIISYSNYGYLIHFLALFVFVGVLNFKQGRSLLTAFLIGVFSLVNAQGKLASELFQAKINGRGMGSVFYKSRIFVIPIFIIFVFISLYSFSNPVFNNIVGDIGDVIEKGFSFVFEKVDFWLLLTFVLSLCISAFLLIRNSNKEFEERDQMASDKLVRKKTKEKRYFALTALKNEYKAAVFLLFILNAVLLVLNIIDINLVWLNFEWQGQTLKQFVHDGTYLLIFSIIISIAVTLYFFRGNLNFYQQNKWLKRLAFVWIIQNGILTLSVAMRNFWYIEYYSLAYKRIGVIIFLLLTLYGLYTVLVKIKLKKSAFYLFKTNTMALYIVLIISSLVNWDSLIAKYNFAQADSSYLELKYMSSLSDKTLPYLDVSKEALLKIQSIQSKKFEFDYYTMSPEDYLSIIKNRKTTFIKKWESKNLLSWNLPEYRAYQKLTK